jgi:hypothetical protein
MLHRARVGERRGAGNRVRADDAVACEPALKTDQIFGEHGTINQLIATPIGVQSCLRFTGILRISLARMVTVASDTLLMLLAVSAR